MPLFGSCMLNFFDSSFSISFLSAFPRLGKIFDTAASARYTAHTQKNRFVAPKRANFKKSPSFKKPTDTFENVANMLRPPQKPVAIKFSNSVFFCAIKEIAAESVKAPAILHIKTDRKLSEIASLLPTLQEPQMRPPHATASECTSSLACAKYFSKKGISIILDNSCAEKLTKNFAQFQFWQ